MPLKTLEEHNKETRIRYEERGHNGIACPKCENELSDTGIFYKTLPATQGIECLKCEYRGERY